MLGNIEGKEKGILGWGDWMLLCDSMDMSLSGLGNGEGQGRLVCAWGPYGHKSQTAAGD